MFFLLYLDHVRPDFVLLVGALNLDDLHDPGRQGVVVHPEQHSVL